MTTSIIYETEVKSSLNNNTTDTKTHIRLCEGEFKNLYANQIASFRHRDKDEAIKLVSYVWTLKDNEILHEIQWKVTQKSMPYRNELNKCRLCLADRAQILFKS